jgi:hypothetical protein
MTGALATIGFRWTPLAQRGLVGLVFGALALSGPHRPLPLARVIPILLFYAMADGLVAAGGAARAAYVREPWAVGVAESVAGLAGVLLLGVWPDAGIPLLVGSVAVWATVTAIAAITSKPPDERVFAEGAVVLMRFTILAVAAARSRTFGVAVWAVASALAFTVTFVVRLARPENRPC